MSYDPNPYNDKPLDEALQDLFDRFTPRSVRTAIFAMAGQAPATFTEKTITDNGTYIAATDNVSGYSKVTVNVSTPVPEVFEVTLQAEETTVTQSSKTYAEVMAALEAGKSLQITLETTSRTLVSDGYMLTDGSIIVSFPYDEPYQQYIMMLVWNNPEVYTSEYQLAVTDRAA